MASLLELAEPVLDITLTLIATVSIIPSSFTFELYDHVAL